MRRVGGMGPGAMNHEEPVYEILDHTADMAVRIRGDSLSQLFERAAFALFDNLVELDGVAETHEERIQVEGQDRPELMVNWLNQLLFLWESRLLLFKRFEVTQVSDTSLSARAWGETYDDTRHAVLTEVKAATYHQLQLEETAGGWRAQLVFDI